MSFVVFNNPNNPKSNEQIINEAYEAGACPRWYWQQHNGKSANENLILNSRRFCRRRDYERLKEKIQDAIQLAVFQALKAKESEISQAIGDAIVDTVHSIESGKPPKTQAKFEFDMSDAIAAALAATPFKLMDMFFYDIIGR